jgi:predicted ATPase
LCSLYAAPKDPGSIGGDNQGINRAGLAGGTAKWVAPVGGSKTDGGNDDDILQRMITLVEARGFRCLRYISRPLDNFHVLVGPNASGKTTFLDVVAFLGDLVTNRPDEVVGKRTGNFHDLTWWRKGKPFELAVEVRIPDGLRQKIHTPEFDTIRYEVALGLDSDSQEIRFLAETAIFKRTSSRRLSFQGGLFPTSHAPPQSILQGTGSHTTRAILNKVQEGNDNFYSETYGAKGKGWVPAFKLGPRRSALANLPEDESKFPVATWLKALLSEGVQQLILNSLLIRQASRPGQGRSFLPDGSNLPWVVDDLEKRFPGRIKDWVAHLRTALPDLEGIRTVERPDDRHRYLMLRYLGGLEIPSWMASDGTLRLLALTLPAYLPDLSGIYLIEEPENGIHPRAVETMFQSLSSVYGAQVLLATHSPVILSLVEPEQLLCFAKTPEGATDIVLGSEHPALQDWKGETSLSTLFASGVLGYGE